MNITFTWLNAIATISYVKVDVATIQRRPLFKGSICYTLRDSALVFL